MTKQPPKVCMYSYCKGQLVDLGYTGSDGNDVFRCVECGAKQSIKGHRNWKEAT